MRRHRQRLKRLERDFPHGPDFVVGIRQKGCPDVEGPEGEMLTEEAFRKTRPESRKILVEIANAPGEDAHANLYRAPYYSRN